MIWLLDDCDIVLNSHLNVDQYIQDYLWLEHRNFVLKSDVKNAMFVNSTRSNMPD